MFCRPIRDFCRKANTLQNHHIEARTKTFVTAIQPGRVTLKQGEQVETIATATVLWAAVLASPLISCWRKSSNT